MVYDKKDIKQILKIIREYPSVQVTSEQFAKINTDQQIDFKVSEPIDNFDWREPKITENKDIPESIICYFDFETDPGYSSETNTHIPIMVRFQQGETKE